MFELWPLVQRLILDLKSVSSKQGIEVVNDIPRTLTVCADAGLISQVFQNLLGNAFKYAAQGRIIVSAQEGDGAVACVVHDTGAGIPLEMLAKVFDKLATDPEKAGTGLGLAIVKQIVEAHGGSPTARFSLSPTTGPEFRRNSSRRSSAGSSAVTPHGHGPPGRPVWGWPLLPPSSPRTAAPSAPKAS